MLPGDHHHEDSSPRPEQNLLTYLLTYLLMPIAPSGSKAIYDPSSPHSVLGCSGHSRPVSPLLFQLSFSVLPPTVARPASLSLPLRVLGQGLACGPGCWLPEGVSDPAPLPPQYLLGHWFLSLSLPQIISEAGAKGTNVFLGISVLNKPADSIQVLPASPAPLPPPPPPPPPTTPISCAVLLHEPIDLPRFLFPADAHPSPVCACLVSFILWTRPSLSIFSVSPLPQCC